MNDERLIPTSGDTSAVTHTLLVDGSAVPATFELLSVVTEKEAGRIPRARLTFRDGDAAAEDFPLAGSDDLAPGRELEIQAGYASQETTLFKGLIVRHSLRVRPGDSSMLVVECQDAAVKMTIGRRSRVFEGVTDADVMEELIAAHGLEADVEATDATHPELVQLHATDWDFVLSRADVNGRLVIVDDGTVAVTSPEAGDAPVMTALFGGTIYELDAAMDARWQFQNVRAYAWDPAAQEVVLAEGTAPPPNGLGDLSEDDLAAAIGLDELELRHSGRLAADELQAWADARRVRAALAKTVGRARVQGFPDVKPGHTIDLGGLSARFSGTAYVTAVRHEIVRGTWRTDVQFGLPPEAFARRPDIRDEPAAGLLPGVHGLQIGVATALEGDPEGEDRVRVRLPLVDAEGEGLWARWAAPDAGAERGVFFRPEIGDEVVVGFLNGDPRDPIVLGMLHSSAHPAPIALSDDNHEKGIVTREGLRLHFDDGGKVVTIDTPGGHSVVVSDADEAITLTDAHGNSITMNSDGVTIDASNITLSAQQEVTIEAGTNLTAEGGANAALKAGAQLTCEGSAGADFKSSAIAKLEGSMVMIN